jgi:excisionase family DNA binding protein
VSDLVYSPGEVAALLKIHPETVRRWLVAGTLPGRKVGGLWLVSAARLQAWVDSGGDTEDVGHGRGLPEEVGRSLGGRDLGGTAGPPDDDTPRAEP